MARKPATQTTLEGWEVEPFAAPDDAKDGNVKSMPAHASPSLEAMRKKFLTMPGSDATPATVKYGKLSDDLEIVRVRPKGGGDAKVAFRTPDGKIEIIQG
jgi:hypothetical protein